MENTLFLIMISLVVIQTSILPIKSQVLKIVPFNVLVGIFAAIFITNQISKNKIEISNLDVLIVLNMVLVSAVILGVIERFLPQKVLQKTEDLHNTTTKITQKLRDNKKAYLILALTIIIVFFLLQLIKID